MISFLIILVNSQLAQTSVILSCFIWANWLLHTWWIVATTWRILCTRSSFHRSTFTLGLEAKLLQFIIWNLTSLVVFYFIRSILSVKKSISMRESSIHCQDLSKGLGSFQKTGHRVDAVLVISFFCIRNELCNDFN